MPHRWKRPQWSLRSFILFCLVSGMLLGWIGRRIYLPSQTPAPILGPLTSDQTGPALPVPSDGEILRAIKDWSATSDTESRLTSPHFSLLRLGKEKVDDSADPVRTYPLIGSARLHHRIYRCVVLGTYRGRPHCEIVYIDHNNLHLSSHE